MNSFIHEFIHYRHCTGLNDNFPHPTWFSSSLYYFLHTKVVLQILNTYFFDFFISSFPSYFFSFRPFFQNTLFSFLTRIQYVPVTFSSTYVSSKPSFFLSLFHPSPTSSSAYTKIPSACAFNVFNRFKYWVLYLDSFLLCNHLIRNF